MQSHAHYPFASSSSASTASPPQLPGSTAENPAKTNQEIIGLFLSERAKSGLTKIEIKAEPQLFWPLSHWKLLLSFAGPNAGGWLTATVLAAQPLRKLHNKYVMAALTLDLANGSSRRGHAHAKVPREMLKVYGAGDHILPVEALRLIYLRLKAGREPECPLATDLIFETARWL